MKKIGIYKITNPKGQVYIGQSIDIENRFKTYKRLSCKSQPRLLASLKKYTPSKHKFEVLELCELSELATKEKHYVDLFQTFNSLNGLNIRDGGGNSASLSEEHKQKIANSLKGKKHSQKRIEANRKGQLGKKLSEAHRLKIKENNPKPNLGKKASEETRLKQRLAHLGKTTVRKGCKLTNEQKKALSIKFSGSGNPNYGKNKSTESKLKTSESLKLYWKLKKQTT
jgi:group I intron endonuclease